MFCNPLLIMIPLFFAPYAVPIERREWRNFDEFRLLTSQSITSNGVDYEKVTAICDADTPLPIYLYITPGPGREVVHVELMWNYLSHDSIESGSDEMAFGRTRRGEWRSRVGDFNNQVPADRPFYIRIWLARSYDPMSPGLLCNEPTQAIPCPL